VCENFPKERELQLFLTYILRYVTFYKIQVITKLTETNWQI